VEGSVVSLFWCFEFITDVMELPPAVVDEEPVVAGSVELLLHVVMEEDASGAELIEGEADSCRC
jgi:hypothetical protein